MSRIIVIAGNYPIINQFGSDGSKFVASHGINEDTGGNVVLPQIDPKLLGATFNRDMQEWIIED